MRRSFKRVVSTQYSTPSLEVSYGSSPSVSTGQRGASQLPHILAMHCSSWEKENSDLLVVDGSNDDDATSMEEAENFFDRPLLY